MINIFLAEDHKIVRDGIRFILEHEQDLNFIGEAENGKDALNRIEHLDVDVMLVDINMPVMNGIELTKRLRERFSNIRVVILSMLDHENYLTQAFEAGAKGYLLKLTGKEELLTAIRTVALGEIYISSRMSLNLLQKSQQISYTNPDGKEIHTEFSKRELEVLNLVAEGYTNEEIADRIFTSKRTVETHRKNMIDKTGTRNSASLIKFAITNGIIK